MLGGEHPRSETCFVVFIVHGDGSLRDDRAVVDVVGDEMHRAAVHLDAVGECAAMRMQAGVGGQQRRMDVEKPTRIARDEIRAQHAHEAGQDDEIRREVIDRFRQRLLE